MKKQTLFVMTLLVFAMVGANAQIDIRNISSVGVDANFDSTVALDVNQVVLFDVTSWLSGELKLQRQDTPVLHETTISVAPIFILNSFNYLIVRYGLGIGAGAEQSADTTDDAEARNLSHDLTIDANYEAPGIYANIAVSSSYYPDKDYWFVLPTVAARFALGPQWSLLGRYFFSYNSEQAISNAILSEAYYQVGERFSIKGGATGSLDLVRPAGSTGDEPRESQWELTGIAGFSYRIRPTLSLRYHLEYLGRLDAADGIRNILVLDATF